VVTMLAVRRAVRTPALARPMCSFLTKVKSMEEQSTKMAATLPAGLKEIAESGTGISAELHKFASERPELFKEVLAKIAEADKPGVRATVAVAKDPSACKYTEEGTMVHDMMMRVAAADRRMKLVSELEVTLTAADKEAIKQAQLAKAAELKMDPKFLDLDIPSTMKLS